MTRERAIQIMSNYDLNFNKVNEKLFDYGEVAEAFDMAIKALEAPPNDNWEGYSKRLWKSAYERGYDEGYKQACKDKIESPYCAESEDKA